MKRFLIAFALVLGLAAPAAAQDQRTSNIGVSASSGNVAAATATATLPGTQNRVTYICGFTVTGLGATAGVSVTATITNLNNSFSQDIGVPAGVTVPLTPHTILTGPPCLPSSAPNQSIIVSVPSFGSGNTNASVTAWGYQSPF